MPAPSEVKAFADFLAEIKDPAEVERRLNQAKLLAANSASDEVLDAIQIRTLGEYLDSDIETPPELVAPFQVVRGGLNAVIGRSGKGKTVMSLNRLLRWSAGKPLFDGLVDETGEKVLAPVDALRVLVIENEGAAGLFHRQIGLMLNTGDYLTEDDRKLAKENVLIWGDGGYSNLKVDDPAKWEPVRRGVDKFRPDVVFVEPFRTLWKGEENSATEMAVVVDSLIALAAEFECAVLVAHHEKKGGAGEDDKMSAARGSTVLENLVTVMEHFEGVQGVDQRKLSWSKSRHAKAPNPIHMEWDDQAWWYRWVTSDQIEQAVLSSFSEHSDGLPMSISDLHEATGRTKEHLRSVCKRLVDNGMLKRMPSVSNGDGSTGPRYIPATDEDVAGNGGLSV